ncbi:MAG: hypothetical protein EAZ85_08100 [Bacteroidetes bacterium]|nr:MAG: hypothetical protein EAZ85_08100 [Bacteroidota bacterium]TAG89106.1 MAG: hypothetical protein EAZ20_07245 [Bacteroidota bacterium]
MAKSKVSVFDALMKGAEHQKESIKEEKNLNNSSDITQKIIIEEEFKNLIPPLSTEEYQKLEQNIINDGCRDSLVLWDKGNEYVLIDGHNRFKICTENKVKFNVFLVKFANVDAAKDWMLDNQLGKRNVSDETKSYLRGMQYTREKKKLGENQFTMEKDAHSPAKSTAEKLGEIHKVSEQTIKRDEKYALILNKVTTDNKNLRWNILNKTIPISKNMIMSWADETDEQLAEFGRLLENGEPLHKLKPIKQKIETSEEAEEKVRRTKKDVNFFVTKALKSNNMQYLIEAEKILQQVRRELEAKMDGF